MFWGNSEDEDLFVEQTAVASSISLTAVIAELTRQHLSLALRRGPALAAAQASASKQQPSPPAAYSYCTSTSRNNFLVRKSKI